MPSNVSVTFLACDILTSMNIPSSKQVLRKRMRDMLKNIPHEEKRNASQRIVQSIATLPVYKRCSLVFGFIPMQSEPDLSLLYDLALSQGKKVAFPRCLSDGQMSYHLVGRNWREHLIVSSYGNLEPHAGVFKALSTSISEPSIILVPGLAFSAEGQRLGRSMGFFDRFLAHNGLSLFSIGICFALQIQRDLPTEPHDSTLDCVVTESKTYVTEERHNQEKC